MTNQAANSTSAAITKPSSTCWSCGKLRTAHFCDSCGKVQPPGPVDYFTFFGLPRKLTLDVAGLERDFYRLSRKLHPDLYARAGEQERKWSLEQTSLLNDAYRTLKDPIRRTEYLLHLDGIQLEEQSKSATEVARATGAVKKQIVPPDLLEDVFELNMQLEELCMNKKTGNEDDSLIDQLETHKEEFERIYDALMADLQRCWTEWDDIVDREVPQQRKAVRDKMVDVLNRRNYLGNLLRDVSQALGAE
jgi:molecular chaperone HscB